MFGESAGAGPSIRGYLALIPIGAGHGSPPPTGPHTRRGCQRRPRWGSAVPPSPPLDRTWRKGPSERREQGGHQSSDAPGLGHPTHSPAWTATQQRRSDTGDYASRHVAAFPTYLAPRTVQPVPRWHLPSARLGNALRAQRLAFVPGSQTPECASPASPAESQHRGEPDRGHDHMVLALPRRLARWPGTGHVDAVWMPRGLTSAAISVTSSWHCRAVRSRARRPARHQALDHWRR